MIGRFGIPACALALATGCTSPVFKDTIFEAQPDPDLARAVSNAQQVSLDVRQISEQVAVLNNNQEQLDTRLTRLEAQIATLAHWQEEAASLRRDMQGIRAERAGLRREITDDLAGRVEKIAARQQAEINATRNAVTARASAAPGSGGGYEHKVERGQNLSIIARGYGKTVEAIMKANNITNPSLIREGQVLFIPD